MIDLLAVGMPPDPPSFATAYALVVGDLESSVTSLGRLSRPLPGGTPFVPGRFIRQQCLQTEGLFDPDVGLLEWATDDTKAAWALSSVLWGLRPERVPGSYDRLLACADPPGLPHPDPVVADLATELNVSRVRFLSALADDERTAEEVLSASGFGSGTLGATDLAAAMSSVTAALATADPTTGVLAVVALRRSREVSWFTLELLKETASLFKETAPGALAGELALTWEEMQDTRRAAAGAAG